MKKFLKFPIIFTVIAVSACRSHNTVEVSNYSTNDSCEIKTYVRALSLTNIEQNESIVSRLTQDHMEFNDGTGEIRIHSNGEVSIKGLKSAYLTRHDIHKQSATTATIKDSLTAKSHTKSTKTTDVTSKANTTIPATFSLCLKILSLIVLIILSILSILYIKKLWYSSKNF